MLGGCAHDKGEIGDRTGVKKESVKVCYEHSVEKTLWLSTSSPVLPGNFTACLLDTYRYICMCVNIQMQRKPEHKKRPQTKPLPKNVVYKMDIHCILFLYTLYDILYISLYIYIYKYI